MHQGDGASQGAHAVGKRQDIRFLSLAEATQMEVVEIENGLEGAGFVLEAWDWRRVRPGGGRLLQYTVRGPPGPPG